MRLQRAAVSALVRATTIRRQHVKSSITPAFFSSAAHSHPHSHSHPNSVALHSLDFPFLKSPPTAEGLDFSRGTSVRDAPLLIMHGLLGSAGNWRTTAPKLSSTRRIISVDVRNHGLSPHVDDMRFSSCAEDVIRLMDEKQINKAIVMGHSLGAKILMAASLLHPDRIVSVISVDMAPLQYGLGDEGWSGVAKIVDACARIPLHDIKARSEVDQLLKPTIPDFSTRAFVLQNLVSETSEDITGVTKQKFSWRCNLQVLHRALPVIAKFDLGVSHHVEPYHQPSLFIGGGKSPYLTSKQFPAVREHFPRAEIVTVPDAGHWVHVDKTQEFIRIVRHQLQILEQGRH